MGQRFAHSTVMVSTAYHTHRGEPSRDHDKFANIVVFPHPGLSQYGLLVCIPRSYEIIQAVPIKWLGGYLYS